MLCPACDTTNEDNARFCRVCGTPLEPGGTPIGSRSPGAETGTTQVLASPAPRCTACGRDNPIAARYCVYCAARLDTPAAPGGALAPVASAPAPVFTGLAGATGFTFASSDVLELALRGVWFVLVGWWLGLIWTLFAWLFNLTIIGLPVGVMMLNAMPQVMTLQRSRRARPERARLKSEEHPFILRALWFVLIGFWASLLWMLLAWAFTASLLLLPIGFWMFDRVPTITTLAQEP